MKTWQGLNAEEIASIPNDEYRLQKVEKILKERNELKDLIDKEMNPCKMFGLAYGNKTLYIGLWFVVFEISAKAILKKASEK